MEYEVFKEYMQRYEREKEEEKRAIEYNNRVQEIIDNSFHIEYNHKLYYVRLEKINYRAPRGNWTVICDIVTNIGSKYVIVEYGEDEYFEVKDYAIKYLEEKFKNFKR